MIKRMPAQRLCLRNRGLRAEALPGSCLCNAPAERTGFFFLAAVVWVRARVFVIAFFTTSRAPRSAVASAQKSAKSKRACQRWKQAPAVRWSQSPRGAAPRRTSFFESGADAFALSRPTRRSPRQASHARLRARP